MSYDFSPYIGSLGLLSQRDLDQGDTCQRIGTYFFLGKILELEQGYREKATFADNFEADLFFIRGNKKGRYRRHGNPMAPWWEERQLSRDQKSILMLAMAVNGLKSRLWDALHDNLKRFGFHQNTLHDDGKSFKFPDLMTPHEFSAFIRGMDLWALYPILYLFDFIFILEVLFFRKTKLWDYDNMLFQQLAFAQIKYQTFVSKIAFKLYQRTDFMHRLYLYHAEFGNGIEPLYEMFKDVNVKLLKEGKKQ